MSGILKKKTGIIDLPIGRKEGSMIERCIDFNCGKTSITHYKVLNEFDKDATLIEVHLITGRTHQIRVHTASICHPIVGDTLYGSKSGIKNGQALHSYRINCIHPISNESLSFIAI